MVAVIAKDVKKTVKLSLFPGNSIDNDLKSVIMGLTPIALTKIVTAPVIELIDDINFPLRYRVC